MKKMLTLLMALVMMFALTACGGDEEPAPAPAPAPAETTAPAAPAETAEEDLSGWSCYMGVMEDGETTIYYAYAPTGDRGAMVILSADATQSVSFIGDYYYDESEGVGYITDDETGLTVADISSDNGDGTYTVYLGDMGEAVIAEADPAEVLAGIDTIAAETQDVTAEFAAMMEENAAIAEEDLSDWFCYAGVMDDGSSYLYYAYAPTGDRAALVILSADATQSISFIGDYYFDEAEGIGYITDDATGMAIADITTDNGDGTYTVDFGNMGTGLIEEADPAEVLAGMDTIAAGTQDVTAEFIAAMGN